MLQIRAEQMAAFEAAARERLIGRVARFLREQVAGACAALEEEALRARIARSLEAGKRHGITKQWDLARFAACAMCLGESFESDPAHWWPRGVLARGDLDATQKMDRIEKHYLRPRIRRAAG